MVAGVVAGIEGADRPDPLATTLPYLGGKLSPFDAWLLMRGLRTLPIRMQRARGGRRCRSRGAWPRTMPSPPVHHPGLGNHLPDGLTGTSGLFSFEFKPGIDIPAFCDKLRLFKLGVSWGGHESLVVPGRSRAQAGGGPQFRHRFRHRRALCASACRARRRRCAVERSGGAIDLASRSKPDRNQATEEEKRCSRNSSPATAMSALLERRGLRRHHAEAGRGHHQPGAHRDAEGHRRRVRGGQSRRHGRDHLAALGRGVREVRHHGLRRRDAGRGRDARHLAGALRQERLAGEPRALSREVGARPRS